MNNDPQSAKLLTYTSLCWPILEYADLLWDSADTASIQEIEAVQNKAIRFVKNIRGQHGITESWANHEPQATVGCMQLLLIRSCHPTIFRYTTSIRKSKTQFLAYPQNSQTHVGAHTFIYKRKWKKVKQCFSRTLKTHRHNLEPRPLYTKYIGTIFTPASSVIFNGNREEQKLYQIMFF